MTTRFVPSTGTLVSALLGLALVSACGVVAHSPGSSAGGSGGTGAGGTGSGGRSSHVPAGFLRVQGRDIVDGEGTPFVLRGISFGNEVWANTVVPNAHHGEEDFDRVKAMGFNSIRFYLSYRFFESDGAPYSYAESGFAWLEQNVA